MMRYLLQEEPMVEPEYMLSKGLWEDIALPALKKVGASRLCAQHSVSCNNELCACALKLAGSSLKGSCCSVLLGCCHTFNLCVSLLWIALLSHIVHSLLLQSESALQTDL